MALHVYGAIVTANGTAANNRGLTEGNITSLQKLVWNGQVHTSVSAEAIRFAVRRRFGDAGEKLNRTYDDETRSNGWTDPEFTRWVPGAKEQPFIDDDLLGFMSAKAAGAEGSDGEEEEAADGADKKKAAKKKGTTKVRRAVLEITRAVSLTPWAGDVTFNAASPGATPSAEKKGAGNPVPYGTEMHATRYQYGFAMTPASIRANVAQRAKLAIDSLVSLGEVAGNHGRFLFDFSAESIVLRITHEAAPRILYGFDAASGGAVSLASLIAKVQAGDVPASELFIGGPIVAGLDEQQRAALSGASLHAGVRAAAEAATKKLSASLSEAKA